MSALDAPPPVSSPTPSSADPTLPLSGRQNRFERAWRCCKHRPVVDGLLGVILLVTTAVGVSLALRRAKKETTDEMVLKGHTGTVSCVCFSPDGKCIVSGSDDTTVKMWDAHTGQEVLTLQGHTWAVNSVAFSADGKRIVSGSGNLYTRGEVKVWDAVTGQEQLSLKVRTSDWSVVFSPDGKRNAEAINAKTVKAGNAQTGQEQLSLKGASHPVAFSPDGNRIVSGSGDLRNLRNDNTLKVWDAHTGQEQLTLQGHRHWVHSVAFSPDGKRIVSGGGVPV